MIRRSTPASTARADGVGGEEMHALIRELFPICRSITGDGVRETLRRLQHVAPIEMHEVESGTPVLDWTVPNEWNVRDAWVKNSAGERVVDFRTNNLHVLNYSAPVHRTVSLAELKEHCFSLPEHPYWVPYRTSYYKEAWGFCLSARQLAALPEGDYEVCVDSTLTAGHLTYGELYLPGRTGEDVLVSAHICHPSLANDNLSGVVVAAYLAALVSKRDRRLGYRFLFVPGTIGSITWLALHQDAVPSIRHGLVLAGVGDAGHVHYKKSRQGSAPVDRAVAHVLRQSGRRHDVAEFSPYGYDERQYCSPGFDLAVGSLSRTPYGKYPEYHTSADTPDFVKPEALADSLSLCADVCAVLEDDRSWLNCNPRGEPQLGRRGLYGAIGGNASAPEMEMALLWVLNLSDGQHTLLDIADRAGLEFGVVAHAARLLAAHDLLDLPEGITP